MKIKWATWRQPGASLTLLPFKKDTYVGMNKTYTRHLHIYMKESRVTINMRWQFSNVSFSNPLQSEFSLLFTIVTNHRPVVEVSLEPMVEFIATILKGSGSNIKASSQNEMRISSRTVKESSEVGP